MQVFFQDKIYELGRMTIIGNVYLALSIWQSLGIYSFYPLAYLLLTTSLGGNR